MNYRSARVVAVSLAFVGMAVLLGAGRGDRAWRERSVPRLRVDACSLVSCGCDHVVTAMLGDGRTLTLRPEFAPGVGCPAAGSWIEKRAGEDGYRFDGVLRPAHRIVQRALSARHAGGGLLVVAASLFLAAGVVSSPTPRGRLDGWLTRPVRFVLDIAGVPPGGALRTAVAVHQARAAARRGEVTRVYGRVDAVDPVGDVCVLEDGRGDRVTVDLSDASGVGRKPVGNVRQGAPVEVIGFAETAVDAQAERRAREVALHTVLRGRGDRPLLLIGATPGAADRRAARRP